MLHCPKCKERRGELFPCVECGKEWCDICLKKEMFEIKGMTHFESGIIARPFYICCECGSEMFEKGREYRARKGCNLSNNESIHE